MADRRNGTSDIGLLEISPLEHKARIRLNSSLETFLLEIEARFLAMTGRVCARPLLPADRIIGAAAIVEGIPLVAAHDAIRHSNAVRTIW